MKLDTTANRNASLEKAHRILLAFSDQEPELGVMELSRRVGLNKSTASRFIATLIQLGLLERVDGGRRLRLSLKVFELGMVAIRRCAPLAEVRPALARLSQQMDETAAYGVLIDGHLVFVERADPASGSAAVELGRRYCAETSAAGQILLAGMIGGMGLAGVGTPCFGFNPPSALAEDLGAVRAAGWAIDRGEWQAGLMSAAAAVFDRTGHTVGAVTLIGAPARMARTGSPTVLAALTRTANDISRRFGCHRGRPSPAAAPALATLSPVRVALRSA